MEITIQERLKDLRVERGLTLEQLAEETKLSKSALGSYESDDGKDIYYEQCKPQDEQHYYTSIQYHGRWMGAVHAEH